MELEVSVGCVGVTIIVYYQQSSADSSADTNSSAGTNSSSVSQTRG